MTRGLSVNFIARFSLSCFCAPALLRDQGNARFFEFIRVLDFIAGETVTAAPCVASVRHFFEQNTGHPQVARRLPSSTKLLLHI